MGLEGRLVLVTGASRGIGRSVARRIASAGGRVGLVARNAAPLEDLADELGGVALPADVSDPEQVDDMVSRFRSEMGGAPQLVVHSAGVFSLGAVAEESVKAFDQHLAVNLRAAFLVIRAVLPEMLAHGGGTIVTVGSVAGRKAFPGNGAYSASKFGLRGLHEVLLEETRGTAVRVTLLEPAATDTTIWDPLGVEGTPDLPGRSEMLRPEDVADAVVFAATRAGHVRIPFLPIERA